MVSSFIRKVKLGHGAAKSSVVTLLLALSMILAAPSARAHEIMPAVADVSITAETVDIDITLTLEALVAELNLVGLADTNDAENADRYDALRVLAPAALEAELRRAWPRIVPGLDLAAGTQPLAPQITGVTVPAVGNAELARLSVLRLSAALPDDNTPVTFGWDAANGPLVVRQVSGDQGYTDYLLDGAVSEPMPRSGVAQLGAWQAFGNYVILGFEHIVPKGMDHILFVLGLFFFSLHLRPLLTQVTAFTLAHTTTLGLAASGVIQAPANIVEPLIAASIVFVAVENIFAPRLSIWRTAVVFAFGLLHGLGFASVLGEIGLDPTRFLTGLIGFNIGVEIGQLAVILGAFLAVGIWFGRKAWYRNVIAIPASAAIAAVGAFWFVQRVTG